MDNSDILAGVWEWLRQRLPAKHYNVIITPLSHVRLEPAGMRTILVRCYARTKTRTDELYFPYLQRTVTLFQARFGDCVMCVRFEDITANMHRCPTIVMRFELGDPETMVNIVSCIHGFMKCDLREARRRLKIYGWYAQARKPSRLVDNRRAIRLFYKWLVTQQFRSYKS